MKATVLAFCFFCATAALGQSIGAPTMSSTYQMATHQQQASAHPMAQEQSLLQGSGSVYIAQGEVPLWEVAPKDPPEVPLGDIARMLRKQHETAKKAQFVYSQVGSE